MMGKVRAEGKNVGKFASTSRHVVVRTKAFSDANNFHTSKVSYLQMRHKFHFIPLNCGHKMVTSKFQISTNNRAPAHSCCAKRMEGNQ